MGNPDAPQPVRTPDPSSVHLPSWYVAQFATRQGDAAAVSRSLRRGALAAVLALSVVPLATACGAGSDAQTLQVQPDVVSTSVGDIQVQDANIITEPNGTGPATVTARVFNNGTQAQQLNSITIDGVSAPVKLTGADGKTGPLTIPANGAISIGGAGNPSALLDNSNGLVHGSFQKTVFTFSSTGQVTLSPAVVPAMHYFQGYGPGIEVTPAPSAPAASPSKPSVALSASPSATGKPGHPVASPSHSAKP
jgi:hypothetical protein